jgi:hypothetical protein
MRHVSKQKAISQSARKRNGGSNENQDQVRFARCLSDISWRNLRGGFVDSTDRFNIPAFFELHAWVWRDSPQGAYLSTGTAG